jgi:acetate kinase
VTLESGVICALRHVHICPEEAARIGFKDQDRIQVAAQSGDRQMLFQNVVVRVSPTYRLEMHLDTDEGNAAGLRSGDHVVLR